MSSGMNLPETLVIIIAFCVVFASFLVYGGNESIDRDSLLAFRSKISKDPFGILHSWNESAHFCNWSGVTCGKRHPGRVTVLNLRSQNLEGSLSPHVGNMSFLRELRLANNSLSLNIPQELGALFRLEMLYLTNSFSGEFPTNLSRCSKLRYLSLYGNRLGGVLPPELGLLSELQGVDLSYNSFVGKIPPSLGNLSSLEWFSISNNNLNGSLPDVFGQWKSIQNIAIEDTMLSGPIPESMYNLSSLIALWLSQNKFNGSLPVDIGLTLPNLEIFSVSMNQFNGPIPISISNLTVLRLFEVSTNGFTGNVPYVGALCDLQYFELAENSLGYGEDDDLSFMYSLLNCTSLQQLGLTDNRFGGMMPEFLSNFSTNMIELSLGKNQIRGRIPTDIGNLINLRRLGMQENILTGSIPSSIGKLKTMYQLSFARNELSGRIPSNIGNLTWIAGLDLSQNKLQGNIPPSIDGCRNMLRLNLYQNGLSGSIPKELFSISSSIELDLSRNMLTGSLPSQVGNLDNLIYLNLSENNLSGEIPQTLGKCTSLEALFLAGNFFHREIPSSLDALRALQYLDLSRNNLSGQVPNYFENFNLILYLNLSWNDFEGRLPDQGVFINMTAFSVTGNKKLCGGIPALHMPSCPSKKSKPYKLILIVSLASGLFGIMLVSFIVLIYMSRRKRKMSTQTSSSEATSFQKASYDDLLKATNGFSPSNLVGVGGFGSVFKGVLSQESVVVAVKVLNLAKKGATKSFMAECEVLRNIRHRNLVKIITACSSIDFNGNDFKALVYEFMINGSLEDWLHPVITNESNEQKHLSFLQRFNIVLDVASALDYLHNDCQTPIVHCDLKPSNILIDEDMVARVGDFGLARLCPEATHQFSSTDQSSSIGIKGSIGYAAPGSPIILYYYSYNAPVSLFMSRSNDGQQCFVNSIRHDHFFLTEYGLGSEASTYGDVYSFGILMLEIFTGKRPTDNMFKDGLDIHSLAEMSLRERDTSIADPIQFQNDDQLTSDKFWDCFVSLIELGVACSVESPKERMNIRKVVEELIHIKDTLVQMGGKSYIESRLSRRLSI